MKRKLLAITSVNFEPTGQLIIIYSAFIKYSRKKWEYNEAVHQLFIDSRKPMIQLGGRSYIIFTVETNKANTVVSE
jgi:hypothetical protein